YRLTAGLALDDWPDDPAGATVLQHLSKSGFDRFYGRIDTPTDTDVIQFEATRSGGIEIRLQPIPGSEFDGLLLARDAVGNVMVYAFAGANGDAAVRLNVQAGQ